MAKTSFLRYGLLPCVVSGVLLSLSFPFWACEFSEIGKTGIGLLAWVALVPVMLLVLNAKRMQHVVLAGIITGTVSHFLLLYWLLGTMHNYGYMSWPLSVALLLTIAIITSLFMVLTLVFMRCCSGSLWLFFIGSACVWVLVEYFRTYAFTGLPWALLGYTQFQQLKLMQIVDITGVYGVSFLLVLFNAALALLLNALNQHYVNRGKYIFKGFICLVIAVIFIAAAMVYGQARKSEIYHKMTAAPLAKIALVQASVPQNQKWEPEFQMATMQAYAEYTFKATKDQPDLIVWPETALPFHFPQNDDMAEKIFALVNYVQIPLFTGAPRYEIPPGETNPAKFAYFNSAFLIVPNEGIMGVYDKAHLVPFGEYVPWKRLLFFMQSITGEGFKRGEPGAVVRSPALMRDKLVLGTLICYEGIFPGLARSMVKNDANLLVNITNDAWYDYSAGPYQHFIISMFRGVETRTSFVRCANTGISAYVLPTGEILYQTKLFDTLGVAQSVPLMSETTFYTRNGDLFAKIVSIAALILITGGVLTGRRREKYEVIL